MLRTALFCLSIIPLLATAQVANRGIDLSGFSTDYHSLPFIDLDTMSSRQVTVDREPGVYLGHPTTVLLEDGQTLYCTYPKGHGRGPIVLKRSDDGGQTWSKRLPVPASWESSLEVPTLYPAEGPDGTQRLLLFSGLYPARMAYSEDQGNTWTELQPLGNWGGIVVMGDLVPLRSGKGHYMAVFHDDGRYFSHRGRAGEPAVERANNQAEFTLYKTFSYDGGLTWTEPEAMLQSRFLHLCEPGLIRSPDGGQIAMLLRENSRRMNSQIMFSNDEGQTWTRPRALPNSLNGDRHQAIYTPDGRLLISFRDMAPAYWRYQALKAECQDCGTAQLKAQAGPASPTTGDWVAWIGTYKDLVEGREGQYRIRLKDNTKGSDCAYPALECLSDGTIVATTYGHWAEGEAPYILSTWFKLEEVDKWAVGE